ncbi:MAG: hypothetical protein U0V72_07015 [Cytophagales bacterium]
MDRSIEIFKKYVPENAVSYCYNLWQEHKFYFKITQPRQSKFGDFRYIPSTQTIQITVNGDLNPYAFLVTYLHEVAHLLTFKKYKNSVSPHGKEWKNQFKTLLMPMLSKDVFPLGILINLEQYAQNPKASTCSDHELLESLHQFNKIISKDPSQVLLKNLNQGNKFEFNNEHYEIEKKMRSRVLCTNLATHRKYYISFMAIVKPIF